MVSVGGDDLLVDPPIRPEDETATCLRKFTATMSSVGFVGGYLDESVNQIAVPVEDTRIASSAAALALCTALTTTEVLAIVTGRRQPTLAPQVLQLDLMARGFAVG